MKKQLQINEKQLSTELLYARKKNIKNLVMQPPKHELQ